MKNKRTKSINGAITKYKTMSDGTSKIKSFFKNG